MLDKVKHYSLWRLKPVTPILFMILARGSQAPCYVWALGIQKF